MGFYGLAYLCIQWFDRWSNKHRHPLINNKKVLAAIVTGVLSDQIIVLVACNGELAKTFSEDHVLFPAKHKNNPRVLLSRVQTMDWISELH